jgi:hypothetical protein
MPTCRASTGCHPGEHVVTYTWLWFSVAGVGALHGLNPATGWMLAAAWGVRSGDRMQALRALLPIAIGHATSVALVAGAAAMGLSMDRVVMQILAGALLVVVVVLHLLGHKPKKNRVPVGHAGLALWSFMTSTAHGAGLMIVPAMFALCVGNAATKEIGGSLMLALAIVGVHTAAMLIITGVMATGGCAFVTRVWPAPASTPTGVIATGVLQRIQREFSLLRTFRIKPLHGR